MALVARTNKTPLGIYIHVPFCRSKCQYCDFYSLTTKDPKLMEYAQRLVEEEWLPERLQCLFVWGHSYEFERQNQWELIENLLKTVSDKEDIWYCTNIELVDYCKASEQLKYDLDCTRVYNPTAADIWIVKRATTQPVCIPAGKTVELN